MRKLHQMTNKIPFFFKAAAVIGLLGISLSAQAMFVEDPTEWLKTFQVTEQLETQLKNLEAQLSELKLQYAKAVEIANDAEGHYGYGNLMNSSTNLTAREWSPDTWQDALEGLAGGNPARYQQLLATYKQNNPTLSQKDYLKGADQAKAARYQSQIQNNQAATVNATYAFNNLKQNLQNIYQLSQSIEQTKDEKAATDLNNRLLTQIAYLQTQSLKMQILLNQQLAAANQNRIARETADAKFNDIDQN